MKVTFLIFIGLLFTACGNTFLDPNDINVKAYEPAMKELIDRKDLMQKILPATDDVNTDMRTFELRDFYFYKRLAKTLPKCYQLLKRGKAIRITYKADDCIWLVLGLQENAFTNDVECLKAGTSQNCETYRKDDVKLKVELAAGWTYERVNKYAAE